MAAVGPPSFLRPLEEGIGKRPQRADRERVDGTGPMRYCKAPPVQRRKQTRPYPVQEPANWFVDAIPSRGRGAAIRPNWTCRRALNRPGSDSVNWEFGRRLLGFILWQAHKHISGCTPAALGHIVLFEKSSSPLEFRGSRTICLTTQLQTAGRSPKKGAANDRTASCSRAGIFLARLRIRVVVSAGFPRPLIFDLEAEKG